MRMMIFSLILLFFLSGKVTAQNVGTEGTDQKFKGFNLEGYTESGQKSWDVVGETADVMGTAVKLSNVVANSYGDQKVNVKAKTGTIDQANGNMQLEEDVIITSETGTQLMTDSLNWNRDKDLVTTEDEVMISNEMYMATGKGMTAQPGLKSAQINEDVTVRVDTEPQRTDDKIVTITSDGPMTIDQTKFVAILEDNVVGVQLDQTLKADRMEIYFNKEMNEIQKMVCIGNVVITQGENQSYAQQAVYDAIDKKLTLTGRPKLIMVTEGGNAITASGN